MDVTMDKLSQTEPVRITLDELFKKIFASLAQLIDSFPIFEDETPPSKNDYSEDQT